ncbi:MAG TPA: YihY/virulence factor BrkB family protein [Flavisolibacter sp.]|nr:YihY/virulence factor BrkB family protein [Flavisolibacter sp.]
MASRTTIQERIATSLPAKTLARQSKRIVPPGFNGFSVYDIWQPFLLQLRRTSMVERASGISFNIVMAIPPTLIFIFTLLPYLPISRQFVDELFILIRDIVPGEKNNAVIINFLKDFIDRPRNGLLSFGLLLAVFFSSNAMMGVLRAFDKNYPGFKKRKGLHNRRVALKLTLIVLVLIFICILLLIAQSHVLQWLGVKSETWRLIIDESRWLIIILLTYGIVSFIYRHGPAVAKKWSLLTPGAVFATTLMIIATGLVSYWVEHFSDYNTVYGSIGAIFILMSLIYANSLAVLAGFELNVTLTNLTAERKAKAASKGEKQA